MTEQTKTDFIKSLDGKTLEELKAIEQEVIKEAETVDNEIANTKFTLPTKDYKATAENIQYFLNTMEVGWQYTLGLVTLYDFWNPAKNPKEINYPTLDATLRNIGQMQFKGYDEWKKVITINKFFETLREEYVSASEKVFDVAEKHNIVLDKMKIFEPVGENLPDNVVIDEA